MLNVVAGELGLRVFVREFAGCVGWRVAFVVVPSYALAYDGTALFAHSRRANRSPILLRA